MVEVNLKTEGATKPQSFIIENIFKNKCDIVLNDNIQEVKETTIDEQGKEITKYIYDYYRINNVGYTDSLEEDLKKESCFRTWLDFAKAQHEKQAENVPLEERLSTAEAVIAEILGGEV